MTLKELGVVKSTIALLNSMVRCGEDHSQISQEAVHESLNILTLEIEKKGERMKEKHWLGREAKDKITGFTGIITCHCRYLTGCDQYGLTPKVNKDGKTTDSQWFDEGRIELIGCGILEKEVESDEKGGPNRDAPPI